MAVGDIYSVSLRGRLVSQDETLNVFFYTQTTINNLGISTPQALGHAFYFTLLDPLATGTTIPAVLSTTGLFLGLEIYNLYNPLEIYSVAYSPAISGERGGDPMPNFGAWGFRSARVRRDIRRGQKRFSPVPEVETVDNDPVPGIIPTLEGLAASLGAAVHDITDPVNSPYFTPVVVKRIKEVDVDGNVTYRLPTSAAEADFFEATSWEFSSLTTQNTRKRGRGA